MAQVIFSGKQLPSPSSMEDSFRVKMVTIVGRLDCVQGFYFSSYFIQSDANHTGSINLRKNLLHISFKYKIH